MFTKERLRQVKLLQKEFLVQEQVRYIYNWVINNRDTRYSEHPIRHMPLSDGTEISIQAGELFNCEPRIHGGPWTHVEVQTWDTVPGWEKYHDGGQVYLTVPVELVHEYIQSHGGPAIKTTEKAKSDGCDFCGTALERKDYCQRCGGPVRVS